jgi:hypothetical protein
MAVTSRSIYRAEAVRRYAQAREKSVLPRFVSPRTVLYLWFLLALLLASGFVAWLSSVPLYASGPAAVVERHHGGDALSDDVVLVAFLPPENLSRLSPGQMLFVDLDGRGERVGMPVSAVEPEIMSPDLARQRYGLSSWAGRVITQPAAVSIARLDRPPAGRHSVTYVGSTYWVDVEVGSRRVISLFPLVDRVLQR